MKLNRIMTALFLMLTLTGIAQNTENDTRVNKHYFSLTFGLNMIDNSNASILPFDGNQLYFNTPFFLTAENKFHKNWSLALTVSTNQLKLDNPAVTEPYFSTDLFANYFLDDLIFNNENIDLYIGAGAGIHTLQGQSAASFNVTGGFRYWVSEKVAINLQTIGKINNDGIAQVDNHYQFNLGVAYKFLKKEPYNNDTEKAVTTAPVANQTQEGLNTEIPAGQEPTEYALDDDKPAKNKIPEYKGNVTVASTDLAKNAYEEELIKKNAQAVLNTNILNTRPDGVKKGYHVIIYAFKIKSNLDNMMRLLSEKGMKVEVIKEPVKNLNYISIGRFNTREEAHDYIDHTSANEKFEGSWVYEVD